MFYNFFKRKKNAKFTFTSLFVRWYSIFSLLCKSALKTLTCVTSSNLARIKSDAYGRKLCSVGSLCCEALAAVNRFAFGRLEGHLAFLTALRANSCEHFSRTSLRVLLCGTAVLTSGGLVFESSGCVEFLLTGGEHEIVATIFALQCLVLVHGFFFLT